MKNQKLFETAIQSNSMDVMGIWDKYVVMECEYKYDMVETPQRRLARENLLGEA